MSRTLGILIFDDVEELDFVGPWEVFGMAARFGADVHPVIIAPSDATVRGRYGLQVVPDHSIATAPPLDILLVPGGLGARVYAREEPRILNLVRRVAETGWVVSVCTGALVLAAAGVLDGHRATTHASAFDWLRETAGIEVVTNERWIIEDRIATSAGVSAGVDLALALVAQWYSRELRDKIAAQIEWPEAMSV